MALTNEQKVDPKKFPLNGVGEYLAREGRLELAKHSYKTALTSPAATRENKEEAKEGLKVVNKKLRDVADKLIDFHIIMKKVADLHLSPEIVEMPIAIEDYNNLKEDVAERGIQVPLAINKHGMVICGRNRWKVAKEAGIEEVPCLMVTAETAETIRKYSLLDNLNRRQLKVEERRAWIIELLKIRKLDPRPGRPKGGPRKEGDKLSNVEIAEATGTSRQAVERIEKKLEKDELARTGRLDKMSKAWVKDVDKWAISKGKDNRRDEDFHNEVADKVRDKIQKYMEDLAKGKKMKVEVVYEVQDDSI